MSKSIFRTILFAALATSLLLMLPSTAAAQRIGFGFGFYGPVYPWGYYGPYPYGPYGYGYPGYYGRPLGEVHLKTPVSQAQIYINGAYAGRAEDLKKFYLAPGTYNIEQRIGTDVQKQRVYAIAGRSLKLQFGKPGTPSPEPAPPPPPEATMQPYPPPQAAPQPYPAPEPLPAPPAQNPQ